MCIRDRRCTARPKDRAHGCSGFFVSSSVFRLRATRINEGLGGGSVSLQWGVDGSLTQEHGATHGDTIAEWISNQP
eukprot:934244-Alexandrium_andersonii.AAC.1